ncbi:MAG: DegT/DnrJ/EryC1/StrS aminotransferase family protein [Calditrichaeota bacterium]|nr:DegT/DnrJ/EryC1/StrS aminotransferase family protein [Calditrichota bacterium]
MIPVYEPDLGPLEERYLLEAYRSGWISSKGEFLSRFEHEFARWVGVQYALAASSGTTALHLALLALAARPGDEVIVPALTYVATANAVAYTGARPVFADSNLSSWTLDPQDVEQRITKRTRGIIAVHLYGRPAPMDEILSIAGRHGLWVIEDAAEAPGAKVFGQPVGSLGTIGCFSFFGNKILTTGEGGMVTTNDENLAELMFRYRGQGVSPTVTYWHDLVGHNYRLTNLAAAIGLAQLERIDEILKKKERLAEWYGRRLSEIEGIELPQPSQWAEEVCWMYSVLVPRRDEVRAQLGEAGIETRPFFFPIYKMPIYYDPAIHLPVAESLSQSGINLPSSTQLTETEVDYIGSTLAQIVRKTKPVRPSKAARSIRRIPTDIRPALEKTS